jgi:RNA polymerase-interacting CarD/CdnL/TRCF family regulator
VTFHIGDEVIHATHGLGKIVHIEEKIIHEQSTSCYVVRTDDLTIWIPITDIQKHSLRLPTPPDEFKKLFPVLSGPGELLPEDRIVRKDQLMAQVRDGQLISICKVVRDLTHYKQTTKLNDLEKSILDRALKSLLTEWVYSMNVPLDQAQKAVDSLLGD